MANEFVIKNGFYSRNNSQITGSLTLTDNLTVSKSLSANGLTYPNTSNANNGWTLQSDGNGNVVIDRTRIYADVKNVSGVTLAKGTPVYVSSSVGNIDEVLPASASDANTMPAIFILAQELTNQQEGLGIVSGYINNVDTSAFGEGDVVYVGINGGYTNIKPTGSNLIQNLGIVTKVDVNGSGFVLGTGRSNDVPNLENGSVFWGENNTSIQKPLGDILTGSAYTYSGSFIGDGSALTGIVSSNWTSSAAGISRESDVTITGSLIVSSSTDQTLTIYGSGSNNPIFQIIGSQGELFSIVDSLSGSLFSANNASGLPVLEVFSDDTVHMGTFTSPSRHTTTKNTINTGTTIIQTLSTASYDAIYVDYHIRSGSVDSRVGNIMASYNGTTVNSTETSASQFGDTSGFTFGVQITGSNMILSGSATSDSWVVKTIIRSI